jgi:hypothetical protein
MEFANLDQDAEEDDVMHLLAKNLCEEDNNND